MSIILKIFLAVIGAMMLVCSDTIYDFYKFIKKDVKSEPSALFRVTMIIGGASALILTVILIAFY